MRSDRRVRRADPLGSLWEKKGDNCYLSGFSGRFCQRTGQSGGEALVRVGEHWSEWGEHWSEWGEHWSVGGGPGYRRFVR